MTLYDNAMRTIVDLPDHQLAFLAEVCRRDGISRTEAVRRAVAAYAREHSPTTEDDVFGLWRGRPEDGLAFEDRVREEWS